MHLDLFYEWWFYPILGYYFLIYGVLFYTSFNFVKIVGDMYKKLQEQDSDSF